MVTGAAGNLGRAVAAAFEGLGATVVRLGRKDPVERALERHGRVDVLCNIAGAFRMGKPLHETTDEDWDFLFDANVKTVLNTCRAVVPSMIRNGGGKIVNVGAYAALTG